MSPLTEESISRAVEPAAPAPATAGCGRLALSATLLVVVGLLAIFGYKIGRGAGWFSGGSGPTGSTPGVFASGQTAEVKVGPAPDFVLQSFTGDSVRLADLRGRPVFVNFWANWCEPCRAEAPLLEKTWQDYKNQGVAFLGIDLWDSDTDARKFIATFNITYPSGQDPRGTTALDYGVRGIPESFFIDRQGRIVRKWVGPFTEPVLRSALDEIVASSAAGSAG